MRILLITETLHPGGAEIFVIRLANELSHRHEVTIAVLHGDIVNAGLAAHVRPSIQIERLLIPAKRWRSRLERLLRLVRIDATGLHRAQVRWIRKIVADRRIEVMHSHLFKADLVASRVKALDPHVGHVLTLHGDYSPYLERQADPQLLSIKVKMRAVLDRVDAIAAICRGHGALIEREFPSAKAKTRIIYNGYQPWDDPVRKDGPEERTAADTPMFTFGMVSRGVAKKGWAKAIAAFARLPAGKARLVLVGDGPYLDALTSAELPPNVVLSGFSANPAALIADFDVGLLPTEFPHESLPTVVMEYLACQKPTIATDVGEIREMLTTLSGDEAGTLLPFDGEAVDADALFTAMQAYLDDPALVALHAARAPAAFAKFDMATCALAYEGLYADAVGSVRSATS